MTACNDFSSIVDAYHKLPPKTADYVGTPASELARRARDLGLEGSEIIDTFTPEELETAYNGIGSEQNPAWIRHFLTRYWQHYTPAALIHDLEFVRGGTEKDWRLANKRLVDNINKLIDVHPNRSKIKERLYRRRMAALVGKIMDKYSLPMFNLIEDSQGEPSLKKTATIWRYGTPMSGESWFDDETNIPIIHDESTGEDWIAPFFAGVNSVVSPDGQSTSPAHARLVDAHMHKSISEFASNSLSKHPEALKAYLIRYARSLREYYDKHGHFPKQRIIGHSRGGGGALEFMEALAKEYPELPRVDEYIGLDPYDLPFAHDKNVKRKNGAFVAKRSIIVRPKHPGAIIADASDMDGDGKISLKERIYARLANLFVLPARRMAPFSRITSLGIAVPGVHHSAAPEMLTAAMLVRKAKTRAQAKRLLKKLYGAENPAYIESPSSPLYGDTSSPRYEKAAFALQ